MSAQLISIVLVALGGLAISLVLAFVSTTGLLRLWIVAGCLALVTFTGGLKTEYLTFYEHYGPLGGGGYGVSLLSVSIAIMVGACVHSIPDELQKRVWLKIILAALLMGLVMVIGLAVWMT